MNILNEYGVDCWITFVRESGIMRDAMMDYLSAASSWEIAIKVTLGKLKLPESPDIYVPQRMAEHGISSLPVEHVHALRVADLPRHHNDPFDRMLIAQAQIENLPILTADPQITRYDVEVIWAA